LNTIVLKIPDFPFSSSAYSIAARAAIGGFGFSGRNRLVL